MDIKTKRQERILKKAFNTADLFVYNGYNKKLKETDYDQKLVNKFIKTIEFIKQKEDELRSEEEVKKVYSIS